MFSNGVQMFSNCFNIVLVVFRMWSPGAGKTSAKEKIPNWGRAGFIVIVNYRQQNAKTNHKQITKKFTNKFTKKYPGIHPGIHPGPSPQH